MNITCKKLVRSITVIGVAGVALLGLTACSSKTTLASTPSMCAYSIGTGIDGQDRSLHDIKLPGDTSTLQFKDSDKEAKYFPCGSRNYRVSPTSSDENGQILLTARTSAGTPIKVSLTAQWMVNQDRDAIRDFIGFCEKYRCASDAASGGSEEENFSTKGWNGMLGENFHAVLQTLSERAFSEIDDNVWLNGDIKLREAAAQKIADGFADEMRTRTSSTRDLFCGSSIATTDGKYDCTNVRITDVSVEAVDTEQQDQANKAKAQQSQVALQDKIATDRINLTDRLYPGISPQVRACQDLGKELADCVFSTGPAQVQLPQG